MPFLYADYAALAAARQIGVDYRILTRSPAASRLAHLAVHGGGIAPGTLEVAEYLAGSTHRYYALDGMLDPESANADLALDPVGYDEPQALEQVGAADFVLSWQGVDGTDPVTYLAGLDEDLITRLRDALSEAGFTVLLEDPGVTAATDPAHIANAGARDMGVQIVLTLNQRERFFTDFTRSGRDAAPRTSEFYTYISAVQTALVGLDVLGKPAGTVWKQPAKPVQGGSGEVGDFGVPTLSPLTLDGMPLDAVQQATRMTQRGQRGTGAERFWSSPPRANGDPMREVYEIALASSRPVNRLRFALPRFPQRVWAQWQDADGIWRPLQHVRTGSPVMISITDSLPATIPAGVPDDLRLHPQHFGTGHWMDQLLDVQPVTSSRFRLILTRLPSSAAPRGMDGTPVPYSLGVKDLTPTYRAASREDLPWLPMVDGEYTRPLAGSVDVLGSQVEYLVRHSRASNLLPPSKGVWRCEPQPVPNAVVSVFLDMRDATGAAQVLDRLWLDPVTSGPTLHLYYAEEDATPERFASSDRPLASPLVRPATATPKADEDGLLFEDPASHLDVDNRVTQFDPRQPFMIAAVVNPQFTSTDPDRYTILDNGLLTVTLQGGSIAARLGDREVHLEPVHFGVNFALPFAVAYDGVTLTVRTPWETRRQQQVHIPPGTGLPPVLRLGGPLDAGLGGSMRITALMVVKGRAADINQIDTFWSAPLNYAFPPGYGQDESQHTSANAILRFDPRLITPGTESVCPWGMVGGPPVDYDAMRWTPVPGDFTLRKGLIKFHAIKARHLKLELTNLQPITISTPAEAAPIAVRLYPHDTGQGSAVTATQEDSVSGAAPSGAAVAVEQGAVYEYADAYRIGQSTRRQGATQPTEALYAPDPQDAQVLRRNGRAFPFMPLPGTRSARFTSTGRHRYHIAHIALDTKVAYTVALREVRAYLSDPVAERDTEQYVDLMHNTAFIRSMDGWAHDGQGAMIVENTPPWRGVTMASTTFISRRRVLGVQFAAQTSDPKQLVRDPDFEDESLHSWRAVGDATIESSSQYISTIGSMARVTRGHARSSWAALEALYPTWGDIADSHPLPNHPTWSELTNATSEADLGGVENLRGVTPPPGGRLYAAVRIYTERAMTEPLRLQLVNGDGRILSESVRRIDAAQIAEWYTGVTIRSQPPEGLPTWGDVGEGSSTWGEMVLAGSWGDITQDWDVDNVYDVRARVVQYGAAGTGEWLVDSMPIYSDPLIWEVSRDGGSAWHEITGVRNNPRGVMIFPDLDPNDRTGGTQLRWRVTAFDTDVAVSSVVLRPWYATLSGAVPYMDTLQASGSSTNLADYYPPIESDPYFQAWQHPIPQEWWLEARQWAAQTMPKTPPLPPIVLPEHVVEGTDQGTPPGATEYMLTDAFVINR